MPTTPSSRGFQRSQYSPFRNHTSAVVELPKSVYDLDLTSQNSHQVEIKNSSKNIKTQPISSNINSDHEGCGDRYVVPINIKANCEQPMLCNIGQESDDIIISQPLIKDARSCNAVLNVGEDDEIKITGYRRSIPKVVLCYIGVFLTLGILRLVMHWWKHWYIIATHSKCPLEEAEKILILEDYQGKHQIFYVKDIITLNSNTIREMKKQPEKWINQFPIYDINSENDLYLSLHFSSGNFRHTDSIKMFRCKQLRYIWDTQTQSFQKLQGLDVNVSSTMLHQRKGLSIQEQLARKFVYGLNEISVPMKGVMTLLFLEVLNPFYVFQIFSVCLWLGYNYYYYAAVIVLMSAFGIVMSILQTKKNQDALQNTVHHNDFAVVILDDGSTQYTETKNLVPGDIIEIPSNGCLMHGDAVLLSGNCIVDESILTGESVPVTKTPLPLKRDLIFDKKEHSRHTLFCGTKVLQTRYIGSEKVLAVVINTGNITAKGGLIRSILYPPPVDYKFEQDSYKFITLLGVIACIGFVYTLVTKIQRSISAAKIAIEALDLITIAVPPALPAAMTVGRFYAQKRLEGNNIYCISPRSINVSGSIDCVCFDKTGTLTEDGLDMWGVVPKSSTNQFQIPLKQIERLPQDHLLKGMVTCHSITIMNGVLKGDPLDLKMFESTGWQLEEANVADDNKYDLLFPTIVRKPKSSSVPKLNDSIDNIYLNDNSCNSTLPTTQSTSSFEEDLLSQIDDIGIVREFPFSSSLQRMSVITRRLGDNHFNIYCKGSPEMIQSLCKPESVPGNYLKQLDVYAQQGYRIISMAYKSLDKKMTYSKVQRIGRDKIECDLDFQGFVILENRLKPDTTEVIHSLNLANVRTIMVTGDNILTAISVGKDCGMIPKHQSIITINARPSLSVQGKYEIYYTLTGSNGSSIRQPITSNGHGDINLSLTNSNSAASMDTVDTWTCGQRDGEFSIDNIYINENNKASVNIKKSISSAFTSSSAPQKTKINESVLMKNSKGKKFASISDDEYATNNYRFAMVGHTWAIVRDHFPELLSKFVTRGTIFARMSPDQKQALILELQNLGYYVAMCGDGANDCGALKAAHTGISLSEAESSVASPFTSRNPTISCVPNVIKEGRAALVTSFGIFKYMAAYSIVQFVSVLILYSIDSNLTDIQYLYIDLGLISIFAFFFGQTGSYEGMLVKQPPLNSLIALSPIASLILHLTIVVTMQTIGWYHVQSEPWFKPFNITEAASEFDLACYENYTIFVISCFQYVILAFVFSKGAPYRRPITSNIPFLAALLINLAVILYLTLIPAKPIADFFELIVPDEFIFRAYLIGYGIINFILAIFIESFVVEYLLFNKFQKSQYSINYEKKHKKYLQIDEELKQNVKWPPISYYNCDIQSSNIGYCEDKSSPISYAEISAEHTIDMKAPENSVLNSFFDQTGSGINSAKPVVSYPHTNLDNIDDVADFDETKEKLFSLSHSEVSDYESAQNILLDSPLNSINSKQINNYPANENNSSNFYDSVDDIYHPSVDKSNDSLVESPLPNQSNRNECVSVTSIEFRNKDEKPNKEKTCRINSYNSFKKGPSPVNGFELTKNESIFLRNNDVPDCIKSQRNSFQNEYNGSISDKHTSYNDSTCEKLNKKFNNETYKNCNLMNNDHLTCKYSINDNNLSEGTSNDLERGTQNIKIVETKIDINVDDKLS